MTRYVLITLILALFVSGISYAETVKDIKAEGSCAIVGMSAEQCQLTALQRARAFAIEQAAGMSVSSSTLVTNMALAADFIKSYSKGFIVNEKVEWLPLSQYQKDPSMPPIPEYRVKIIADIKVPDSRIKPFGLKAKANSTVYKTGDKAAIEISAGRKAGAAVFNITADDKVVMLFPNEHDSGNIIQPGVWLKYPGRESRAEIEMQTLPEHKRDAEAFFIAALDNSYPRNFSDIFTPSEPMSFTEFFRKYSEIADYCEDYMLTYEVVSGKGE